MLPSPPRRIHRLVLVAIALAFCSNAHADAFLYRVRWGRAVDTFPYATGWACAAPSSLRVVLGPGAPTCACWVGGSDHIDLVLPVAPGGKLVGGVAQHAPISSDLRLSRGRVPNLFGDARVTLDGDVPLVRGARVAGSVSYSHQESSDSGEAIDVSASGRFEAELCEDRPGALAELVAAASEPTSAGATAVIDGKSRPIKTALAIVRPSAPTKVASVELYAGVIDCAGRRRDKHRAVPFVRVDIEHAKTGRAEVAQIDYESPTARAAQTDGTVVLETVDQTGKKIVKGSVFARGNIQAVKANAIRGAFVATICAL